MLHCYKVCIETYAELYIQPIVAANEQEIIDQYGDQVHLIKAIKQHECDLTKIRKAIEDLIINEFGEDITGDYILNLLNQLA